jgi:hypothetical protein
LELDGRWLDFESSVKDLLEMGLGEREALERGLLELGLAGKGYVRSRPGKGGSLASARVDGEEELEVGLPAPVLVEKVKKGVVKVKEEDRDERNGSRHLDAVLWVSEHLRDEGLSRESAPSGVAWSLLMWCRSAPECEQDFWRAIFPKVLPTRNQIQAEMDKVEDVRCLRAARVFLEGLNG